MQLKPWSRTFLWTLLAIATLALLLGAVRADAAPAQPTSAFEQRPCRFPLGPGQTDGGNVLCGDVSVPERHAVPDGRRLRLHVAVLRSTRPAPSAPPLIVLSGGPAGPSAEYVRGFAMKELTFRKLLEGRDVIVFDQRGVGFSIPSLDCPEARGARVIAPALKVCARRLTGGGFDLAAYNSVENAADVVAVGAALGAPRIDLYGASYGTRLAQTIMRDFPAAVRRVILDAPVPLDADILSGSIATFDAALRRILRACGNQIACRRAYPDLETDLESAYASLNRRAEIVASQRVTGEMLLATTYYLTLGGGAKLVPQLIHGAAVRDRDAVELVAEIAEVFAGLAVNSHGLYLSTQCQEEVRFTDRATIRAAGARVLGPVRASLVPATLDIYDLCRSWPVTRADPRENRPVASGLPVLIMAGEFDPITPPSYAARLQGTLPDATAVTFRGASHGVLGIGACPTSIAQAFLDDPVAALDTRCAGRRGLRFVHTK